ncbi:CrcB family protein [Lentzea tibetensis]|uniref:Fluoride-specific ion channel FluC n=1 Tax=Lentzea tibetensis TaxID=2591470 RepID=A0A563EGB7_9PSEU|nr:CrcB family protein [Lentzea tibetensis]TWP44741.1 CrcB family protein [Lentzea tibetensis]
MPTPADEPIDPDVDLHVPAHRAELTRTHGGVLAVIALGGGLGGVARYALSAAVPGAFGIFAINVLGSFLIGVLMVLVVDVYQAHPLVRPFLGVGVLGGFTTFSAYAVDFSWYLLLTPVCAFAAAFAGTRLVRWTL